ncbi:hypothetical protein SLEP1_g26014 [Rubroshorea leprosula]|uniref:Uncharacterized protein n=1 Tax=Rubroshorea leprosula TaxID=152421 RepID=A0AAV5JUG3_9ROSI|nr:hypothetical protein SLEP1_g26014 [Rubroshorea leprosula]
MRDKLCCKGGGCIKSIEIIERPPPPPSPPPPPPPPPKEKHVKVSVDLKAQVFCYCKCCSGRPWGPCYCGGQVQFVPCHGKPVCDSWSSCGETQPGCSFM